MLTAYVRGVVNQRIIPYFIHQLFSHSGRRSFIIRDS